MLRKFGIIAVLSLLVAAFAAVPALAAEGPTSGVHFTRGGDPTCTITDLGGASADVQCTAELAGLGEGNITTETTITGFTQYTCINRGQNPAPGQNKVLEGPVTGVNEIPSSEIKNGRAVVTGALTTLTADPVVSGAVAGCPNNNWTGVNPELTITSITYEAFQGGVLVFSATTSDPNGLTGTVALDVTGGAVL
jgi:hypothetical protein